MAEVIPKKQHTIEYIGISVLVLVALVVGISRFKKGDKDDEVFSRKEFNKKWEEVEILEVKIPELEKAIEFLIEDDKAPFKSPFDSTETQEVASEEIVLPAMKFQGMIWKSFRPQAIINNKVYDVNDVVDIDTGEGGGEVKVIGIKEDGIHLKYKGKEFIARPK
jgi:hypothetical protein